MYQNISVMATCDGYDTNIRYPDNTHMQVNSNRNA